MINFQNSIGRIKTIFGKAISLLINHKFLIIFLTSFLIVGGVVIWTRSYLISKIKIAQSDTSGTSLPSYSLVPDSPDISSNNPSPTDTPSPADNGVLGISADSLSTPTPFPDPTYTPIPKPSPTPIVVVTPSPTTSVTSLASSGSPHSCANTGESPGIPTFWYSETSSLQTVSDTATININLYDCNNSITSVSDTLTITQSSGPGTTVNSSSLPITIKTTNGQASFTVSSQIAGTAVYIVTDTTRSFAVTDPNNNPPRVTFTISAPTSTPTPTPTSTLTPTPTPSPSDTPTPSPSPT